MNLTCTQVSSLLPYYIEEKLTGSLKEMVKKHLNICPSCNLKYETLKQMIKQLQGARENFSQNEYANPFNQSFKTKLSAYIDNELEDKDNIQVKKYTISNPIVRKDLEKMYSLRLLLKNSYERTKNEMKTDFSKYIMSELDFQKELSKSDPLLKGVTTAVVVLTLILISAVMMFTS